MLVNSLDQVAGVIGKDINTLDGGLNIYNNQAFIEPNQLPFCINLETREPPLLSTRAMRSTIYREYPAIQNLSGLTIKNSYITKNRELFVIVETSTECRVYLLLKDQAGTSYTTMPLSNHYYFCECKVGLNNYLYVMSRQAKLKYELSSESLQPITIEDDIYGIPVFHKDRLFIAEPNSNIVRYSARWEFDSFNTTPEEVTDYDSYGGFLPINSADGDITGMISYDDKLIIFCEDSMHCMYGDYPLDSYAGSNYFQVVDMPSGTGMSDSEHVSVAGNNLFWYGTDKEIHRYNGSQFYTVSKPINTRYYVSKGAISGILVHCNVNQVVGTSSRLYVLCDSKYNLNKSEDEFNDNDLIFVYDLSNNTWWSQDGHFSAISRQTKSKDDPLLCGYNGDILYTNGVYNGYWSNRPDHDLVYDFDNSEIVEKPIEYKAWTKTYGIEYADKRSTLSDIWFQCKANAKVYLLDSLTKRRFWGYDYRNPTSIDYYKNDMIEIGTLDNNVKITDVKDLYESQLYEQQRIIVPKMYGQRLDVFSIYIEGSGWAEFYLLKRNWRVS